MPVMFSTFALFAAMVGLSACQWRIHAPQDTSETSLPDDPTPLQLICNEDYLVPADLPDPTVVPTDPDQVYRVVRVFSEHFEEAYMLVIFHADSEQRLYDQGAPVVVGAIPALLLQEEPVAQLVSGYGVIEVQPIFSGWSIEGVGSSGDPDAGGSNDALLLREAILFASGRKDTVEGNSLGQVVEAPVCNDKVVVLGASGGASIAMQSLAGMDKELSQAVAGFANHESPLLPQLLLGDVGAVWMDPQDLNNNLDEDGDGYTYNEGLNPVYEAGDCQGDTCLIDYSALAFDPLTDLAEIYSSRFEDNEWPGVLYLDLDGDQRITYQRGALDVNQNGWLDDDEDFLFVPSWDRRLPESKHMYSVELVEAAVSNGVLLEDDWPEHIATRTETQDFWHHRNMMHQVEQVASSAPPWFRVAIDFTEVDHGIAAPDRPHVRLFFDAFNELGVPIRYNYSEAMMDCTVDASLWKEAWTGRELPYGHGLEPSELDYHAMVEEVPNSLVKALPALGLLWDMYGDFDRCPLVNEASTGLMKRSGRATRQR